MKLPRDLGSIHFVGIGGIGADDGAVVATHFQRDNPAGSIEITFKNATSHGP